MKTPENVKHIKTSNIFAILFISQEERMPLPS